MFTIYIYGFLVFPLVLVRIPMRFPVCLGYYQETQTHFLSFSSLEEIPLWHTSVCPHIEVTAVCTANSHHIPQRQPLFKAKSPVICTRRETEPKTCFATTVSIAISNPDFQNVTSVISCYLAKTQNGNINVTSTQLSYNML